jgi:hypothetical protein
MYTMSVLSKNENATIALKLEKDSYIHTYIYIYIYIAFRLWFSCSKDNCTHSDLDALAKAGRLKIRMGIISVNIFIIFADSATVQG